MKGTSFIDFLNSIELVKRSDMYLDEYNLSILKLLSMLGVIVVVYFIRKVLLDLFEKNLLKIEELQKYSKKIVSKIRKPLELTTWVINVNLILYIYNDFSTFVKTADIFNILYVLLITWMVYLLVNAIATVKIHNMSGRANIKNEIVNLSMKMVNFVIWIIGLLFVLHFGGVDLTAILSGLGIGGLAVALAAKDSLANFFGTISILVSDTYSQGDWIAADGKEGTVVEIGLRVTTLRTFDNALISLPNAILANKDVKNWSRRNIGRRIKMSIGVTYGSKPQDIKNAVNEIREMLHEHAGIATENTNYAGDSETGAKIVSVADTKGIKKTLLVYLDEFSASSINILIYAFSQSVVWEEWLQTKEDVMYKIMEILERNNLEFAFPSLSIYKEN